MTMFELNLLCCTPALETCIQAGIIISALVLLLWGGYHLFWKPFEWCQDFTEHGFDQVTTKASFQHRNYSEVTRRNIVNEYHQRRRLGDLPPVYPNGWFVILDSDQLKCGGVQEVSALGLNLVAWRGESGKAYVADAYCPHLGAHLGVGGKVAGECITCPFHGWQFQGETGCLVKIPYSETFKPELAKLKLHTILEQNGAIYLWFHAEHEEPNWYPPIIPEIEFGEFTFRGQFEFRIAGHVQDVTENGADINHFNIVHDPTVFAGSMLPSSAGLLSSMIKHVWTGEWTACEEKGKKHVAIMNFCQQVKLFNVTLPFATVNARLEQFGPGILHLEFDTAFGKAVILNSNTPIEPMMLKMNQRFYSARTFIHPLAKLTFYGEAVMLTRDISIWNRKMFLKNPLLPKEDSSVKRFRLWFQQFYSENSPRHYFFRGGKNSADF